MPVSLMKQRAQHHKRVHGLKSMCARVERKMNKVIRFQLDLNVWTMKKQPTNIPGVTVSQVKENLDAIWRYEMHFNAYGVAVL